jgi:hypothetical protein
MQSSKIMWLLLFCGAVLVGCSKEAPPEPADIAGRFSGIFGITEDLMEIHPDGTFSQTISSNGQIIKNEGTWKVEQLGLEFSHIYAVVDLTGKPYLKPVLFSNEGAVWVNYQGHRRIAFNIDSGYVLDREATTPQTPAQ